MQFSKPRVVALETFLVSNLPHQTGCPEGTVSGILTKSRRRIITDGKVCKILVSVTEFGVSEEGEEPVLGLGLLYFTSVHQRIIQRQKSVVLDARTKRSKGVIIIIDILLTYEQADIILIIIESKIILQSIVHSALGSIVSCLLNHTASFSHQRRRHKVTVHKLSIGISSHARSEYEILNRLYLSIGRSDNTVNTIFVHIILSIIILIINTVRVFW